MPVNLEADLAKMRSLADYTRRSFCGAYPTPFGCDIVRTRGGERVFRGMNNVRRESDPSAHAELRAVRRACRKLRTTSLRGHTLYSTCEPCPMCMGSILWAGLDRLVFGATIGDAAKHCGQIHLPAKTMNAKSDMPCEVVGPVERAYCRALFEGLVLRQDPRRWEVR